MDLLHLSEFTLWKTEFNKLYSSYITLHEISIILSAAVNIQISGTINISFSGGMAIVESINNNNNNNNNSELFLLIFSDSNLELAHLLFIVKNSDIIAHVEPVGNFYNYFALCVDISDQIYYIVIGPMPSLFILNICFFVNMIEYINEDSLILPCCYPLKSKKSIGLKLIDDYNNENISKNSIFNNNNNVNIIVENMRNALLKILSSQINLILKFTDDFSKSMKKMLKYPEIIEALISSSLGRIVYFISSKCTIYFSLENKENFYYNSDNISNQEIINKKGFISILQEALVLIPKESNNYKYSYNFIIRWNKIYGFISHDILEPSKEFHIALLKDEENKNEEKIKTTNNNNINNNNIDSFEWLSITLSSHKNCIALEYAFRQAYLAATGNNCKSINKNLYIDITPKVQQYSLLTTISKNIIFQLNLNLQDIFLSNVKNEKEKKESLSYENYIIKEETLNLSFIYILFNQTYLVLKFFDYILFHTYKFLGDSKKYFIKVANLFFTIFIELFPIQLSDNTNISLILLQSTIRVECFLRNLPSNMLQLWYNNNNNNNNGYLLFNNLNSVEEATNFAFIEVIFSPMCREIIVQFMMNFSQKLWNITCDKLSLYTEKIYSFSNQIMPIVLDFINSTTEISFIILFIYKEFCKYLKSSQLQENEKNIIVINEKILHLVGCLYYLSLYRLAKIKYGPELSIGEISETLNYLLKWMKNNFILELKQNSIKFIIEMKTEIIQDTVNKWVLKKKNLPLQHPLLRLESLWLQNSPNLIISFISFCKNIDNINEENNDILFFEKKLAPIMQIEINNNNNNNNNNNKELKDNLKSVQTQTLKSDNTLNEQGVESKKIYNSISTQTIRTSSQEEELSRSNLSMQTRLHFLEEFYSTQQKEIQTKSQSIESNNLTCDGIIPFTYLKTYRSHMEYVSTLQGETEELKKLVNKQSMELITLKEENLFLKREKSDFTLSNNQKFVPFHLTYSIFSLELQNFMIERENHGRDIIIFAETKERTMHLFSLLNFMSK